MHLLEPCIDLGITALSQVGCGHISAEAAPGVRLGYMQCGGSGVENPRHWKGDRFFMFFSNLVEIVSLQEVVNFRKFQGLFCVMFGLSHPGGWWEFMIQKTALYLHGVLWEMSLPAALKEREPYWMSNHAEFSLRRIAWYTVNMLHWLFLKGIRTCNSNIVFASEKRAVSSL